MSKLIPFETTGKSIPTHLSSLFGGESNITPKFSINQLSYRGKVWRLIVDGEETVLTKHDKDTQESLPMPIVAGVILDHNKARSRAYYPGSFEEGKNVSPTCYSGEGVSPDSSVKEPQSKTCASCKHAVKGSKITENGKQTTACTSFKRLAFVPTGAIANHPALLVRLAQTSIWDKDNTENESKGWYAWDQYLSMLRARGAPHTAAVETRIKFDHRMAYPKLLFSASRWLDEKETAEAVSRLKNSAEELKEVLLGNNDENRTPQEELPFSELPAKPLVSENTKKKIYSPPEKDIGVTEVHSEIDNDEPKQTVKTAKSLVTKSAATVTVAKEEVSIVEDTPDGLKDLLDGWDD